jgi:hypothetical protein
MTPERRITDTMGGGLRPRDVMMRRINIGV